MADRQKILVVDDSRTQLEWVQQVLVREGYDVRPPPTARRRSGRCGPSPRTSCSSTWSCRTWTGWRCSGSSRRGREDRFIPVIILSVKADLDSKVAGLRIGADDFLAKPFAEAELLARCAAMLRIKKLQDELHATQRKLEEQSITDSLTGLRNRRFFDERLHEEFSRAQRYSDPVSLIMLDLDHFKRVNDRFGHQTGDLVLRESAGLLQAARSAIPTSRPGTAARSSRSSCPKTHVQGALAVAERIWRAIGGKVFRHQVSEARGAPPIEVRITVSIGIAFFPSKDITSAELLVKYSDEALYQAKNSGRNSICLYQAQAYRYEAGRGGV